MTIPYKGFEPAPGSPGLPGPQFTPDTAPSGGYAFPPTVGLQSEYINNLFPPAFGGAPGEGAACAGSLPPAPCLDMGLPYQVPPPGWGAMESFAAAGPVPAYEAVGQLDPAADRGITVADLINAGVFQPGEAAGVHDGQYPPLKDGQAPGITVQFQNFDPTHQPPPPSPDFVVNQDGSITCVHNPQGPPPVANIVIEVARLPGQTGGPSPAQQQALDNLVAYTGQQIQDEYGDLLHPVQLSDGTIVPQVNIQDFQGLVSDTLRQYFGDNLPPSMLAPNQPPMPDIPQAVQSINQTYGGVVGSGGSATITPEQLTNAYGSAPAAAPGDPAGAMVDTLSAMSGADPRNGYDTVHQLNDGSYNVGRVGFNYGNLTIWLESFLPADILAMLGNPPDWSKLAGILQNPQLAQEFSNSLAQAVSSGLLPGSFARELSDRNFLQGFGDFLEQLKGGQGTVGAAQIEQFLPRDVQDGIAKGVIQTIAHQMNLDPVNPGPQGPGELALAMFLGRVPNQQDLANPSYQNFMNATDNLYQVSTARASAAPGTGVSVSDIGGQIVVAAQADLGKQMWNTPEFAAVCDGGNLGCAASVSDVLKQLGFNYADSASVATLQQQLQAHGWRAIQADPSHPPPPGTVACGYRGGSGSGDAHVGIVGPGNTVYNNHSSNGQWSQDPLSTFYPGGSEGFVNVVWLVPPGSTG